MGRALILTHAECHLSSSKAWGKWLPWKYALKQCGRKRNERVIHQRAFGTFCSATRGRIPPNGKLDITPASKKKVTEEVKQRERCWDIFYFSQKSEQSRDSFTPFDSLEMIVGAGRFQHADWTENSLLDSLPTESVGPDWCQVNKVSRSWHWPINPGIY